MRCCLRRGAIDGMQQGMGRHKGMERGMGKHKGMERVWRGGCRHGIG